MQRIYNIKTGEHLDLWPIDAREILTKNKEWSGEPVAAQKEKPVTTRKADPIESKRKVVTK